MVAFQGPETPRSAVDRDTKILKAPGIERRAPMASGGGREQLEERRPRQPVPGARRTLLMVDDLFEDYEAVSRVFQREGAGPGLQWCETADDAVDYLTHKHRYRRGYAVEQPHAILLDLYLPGALSGFDFLEFVRREPDLRAIPVVVFTSSSSPQDVERAYALGANAYICKPQDTKEFDAAVVAIRSFWIQRCLVAGGGELSSRAGGNGMRGAPRSQSF